MKLSLAFGNVATGQAATASLTVTNRGNRDLTLTGITCPEDFSAGVDGVLAPGQGTNVTVVFSPLVAQAYGGLRVVNSDATGGDGFLPVSGWGFSADHPGAFAFESASAIAEEGAKVTVRVVRNAGSAGPASVDYALKPGTASAGLDYRVAGGTLTWSNGQAGAQVFKVLIPADGRTEGAETFKAVLSAPTGASLGAPSRVILTIPANTR